MFHKRPTNCSQAPTIVCEGVYPQSDGGLAIVDIDASEGFIALWVHLFVAIEELHRNEYRQKRYFFGFD